MSTGIVGRSIIEELAKPSLYDTVDGRKLAMLRGRMDKLSDVEIGTALELAASMGLNPWSNEFYASKSENGRILIMVGRDGLLRKAEEFPDYAGYDCGVVYEGDTFVKGDPKPEGSLRERAGVSHIQGAPTKNATIIGAWAVAERRGRPPRYFFARYDEYATGKSSKSPWGSTNSVMIEKVAISVVHRTLCNLSGVYLPEEVQHAIGGGDSGPKRAVEDEMADVRSLIYDLDVPLPLRERLTDAVERANRISPFSYGLGKVQMTFPGRSEAELERELRFIDEQFPPESAPVDAESEEITDAEVVEPEPVGTDQEVTDETLLNEILDLQASRDDVPATDRGAFEAHLARLETEARRRGLDF